jgi:peptidase MA superfamily protein
MRSVALLGLLATQVVGLAMPETLDGVPYSSIESRRARVWFSPRDSLVARRVRTLLDDQPPLPGLPEGVPTGVQVVLAHSPAAFDEITGGGVPEWRAGVAMPASNTLVMPTGEGVRVVDGEGLRTLRHEWAHLGLSADLGDLRIPRWFNEGYAQWASGGFDVAGAWKLRVLIAAGRAPVMDSLELRWPSGRQEARTAYLLAASAVTYLLEAGGERGLRLFLDRWKAQRSFETAFRDTFGLTVSQFEEDWGKHVKKRYGWLFLMSRSSVFWLVLALVLLFMVRGRHAYDRQRLAKLRATEIPDAPAYWDEDRDRGTPSMDPPEAPQG